MLHPMEPAAMVIFLGVYFLLLLGVYVALAVANGMLAARLGKSVAAWVILSLIPLVNLFFYIYMVYTVLFFIIDRLNGIPSARA
ncbi:MAG TPA: hypothetical protein VND87_06535 [Stellaceae bacterium]|nr:hypothetical protein [Stellaceae bacterium]